MSLDKSNISSTRKRLQDDLSKILKRVYFQPPENIKLDYPCIVYERDYITSRQADNQGYIVETKYTVKLITADVDPIEIDRILSLRYSRYSREIVLDGLHHYIFDVRITQ